MRPRTRLAVSVLPSQIGSTTRSTAAVSIEETGVLPQHRVGVAGQRRQKLLPVFFVAPFLLMQCVVGLGGLFERHHPRRLGALSPPSIDRVSPIEELQPGCTRAFARILKR